MPLTILSDVDINALLLSLTREDVLTLQHNLAEALHEYSTGTQESTGCCQTNQPQRISIPAANNQNTLFMPASTSTSRGMKIVTLGMSSDVTKTPSIASAVSRSPSGQSNAKSNSDPGSGSGSDPSTPTGSTPTSQLSSLSLASTNTTKTSGSNSSPSSLTHTSSLASNQTTTPIGTLTLLTSLGIPYALLSAPSLTAFRTALASTILFTKRRSVHTILIFGAGLQALWHIRLALLLRGEEIHHIHIVNRSFRRAQTLMQSIYTSEEWEHLRTANEKLTFSVVSSEYGEFTRLLKEHVRKADAIFCCTASRDPLFPAEYLTNPEGRKKGRYISMIGSYNHDMVELHPDILKQAVAPGHRHHHHRHAEKGGVVVVDSLSATMKEAGEVRQAGLGPEQLVEIGELLMVKKAVMQEIADGTGEGEKGLRKWLMGGNVLYKSVGLGLMDVCVGEDLVNLARQKGVGTTVEGF
ncbi:MAG: hypothetical protein Q9214_001314 [Letrouitia sp. 1 TL-2023]